MNNKICYLFYFIATIMLCVACSDDDNSSSEKKLTGKLNGHEWVDLGLTRKDVYGANCKNPSKRIVFAKCNIGAETETDCGYYFRWGDLNGWKITNNEYFEVELSESSIVQQPKVGTTNSYASGSAEIWSSSTFSKDWKLYGKSDVSDFQGKVITSGNYAPYGDAATYNMGNGWKMMDETLIKALSGSNSHGDVVIGSVTLNSSLVSKNGVSGVLIRNASIDTEIFLPFAGFCVVAYRLYDARGNYRGSTPDLDKSENSCYMYVGREYLRFYKYNRNEGFSVRGIAEI